VPKRKQRREKKDEARREGAGRRTAMVSNAEVLGLSLCNICDDRKNAPSAAEMQSLIANGANINYVDAVGWSVLMNAVCWGYLNAVRSLLAVEGIDFRVKTGLGNTPLMLACSKGYVEIVKALLAAHKKTSNFDINDTNTHGTTALMRACESSNVEVVRLLLPIPRININVKNNRGMTALDFVKGKANEVEIRALFHREILRSRFRSATSLSFRTRIRS
jgi:ankyrin repeat protein